MDEEAETQVLPQFNEIQSSSSSSVVSNTELDEEAVVQILLQISELQPSVVSNREDQINAPSNNSEARTTFLDDLKRPSTSGVTLCIFFPSSCCSLPRRSSINLVKF